MLHSNSEDSHLHSLLWGWAARFTPVPAMQKRLVEETLETALELIPLDADDAPVDAALLGIMRRIVLQDPPSILVEAKEAKSSQDNP